MNLVTRFRCAILILSVMLVACGGGGGGGGGGAGLASTVDMGYSGVTTQATLTSSNIEQIAGGAYEWGRIGSSIGAVGIMVKAADMSAGAAPRPEKLSCIFENSLRRVLFSKTNAPTVLSGVNIQQELPGAVAGKFRYDISIDDATGEFSGTMTFYGYQERVNDVVVSGSVSFSGSYDLAAQSFLSFSVSFPSMLMTQGNSGITTAGTLTWKLANGSKHIAISMVIRSNLTGAKFWVKDYNLTLSPQLELTISGRYYHPGYGYVEVTTPTPLQVTNFDEWPAAGSFLVIGANGTLGRLTFSADSYQVTLVKDAAPVANAGQTQSAAAGASVVTLDGSGSSDANGDPLSFHWALTSKPTGSNAVLSDSTAVKPSFVADIEGDYIFSLVVNDGYLESDMATVEVSAWRPIIELNFRPLDAEYSKSLDRIIMIAATPANQLHIYNPTDGTDVTVNLAWTPTCVSVSPDGLYAAVGHNAWISYVNLASRTLIKTIPVTADIYDVVLAGNGYVYAIPNNGGQWTGIHNVEIATGLETVKSNWEIYGNSKAKLHPSGNAIYTADYSGISPCDLNKFDISGGPARHLYDSPYHGEYPIAGDLWLSEEGARIFTRGGNAFRASASMAEDMAYNGSIENRVPVKHLSHSAMAGKMALIPENTDTQLRVYDYDYLTLAYSKNLPYFVTNTKGYASHGHFTFFNSAGTKIFVVLQADPTASMLYDYGIVTY